MRRWIVTQLGIAALFLAWLPITIRWARSVGAGFWLPPMTIRDLWTSYVTYAGGSSVLLVLLFVLILVGLYAQRHNFRGITLMLSLATLPVIVPVIVSILSKPSFTPRYGIVGPAALFALAGCGVIALRNRIAQSVVTAGLVALSLAAIRDIPPKPDWRGTVAQVETVARPRDYIVMTPRRSTYIYDYYAKRTDVRRKGFDSGAIPLSVPMNPGVAVWFIYERGAFDPKDVLERGAWRVRSTLERGSLTVLELDDGTAPATAPTTQLTPTSATPPRSSTH